MPNPIKRTVFFISDGTGLTAEALGHSLLTQFEDVEFRQIRVPFLDSIDKAQETLQRINSQGEIDGMRPIVFTTLVNQDLATIIHQADAFCLSYFETFLAPAGSRTRTQVQPHRRPARTARRKARNTRNGSRRSTTRWPTTTASPRTATSRKPTSSWSPSRAAARRRPRSTWRCSSASRAANFPLIPEDFDRGRLPGTLEKHRGKLFGLTIQPERLHQIREERRAGSKYAALPNCRYEIAEAEKMMRREGIRWLDSSTKSIEEISATILQELNLR